MKKSGLIVLMVMVLVFTMTSLAMAVQEDMANNPNNPKGNIVANTYDKTPGTSNTNGNGDYQDRVQEQAVSGNNYTDGFDLSTHMQGTWNSPYTAGVDGYGYNDPQDYVADGDQIDKTTGLAPTSSSLQSNIVFQSGPHGGYLTTTHRCRECHAVHRAAGKFKLLRSDTRFEACDWCHGTGAGSGFNIQMDNNDLYTTEYNVGHTMGFGIASGKWRAPDDTYPAFAPNYYMGGFTCFDCHSPHANPARLLGFNDQGQPGGLRYENDGSKFAINPAGPRYYAIVNPGHNAVTDAPGQSIKCTDCHKVNVQENVYVDPDTGDVTVSYNVTGYGPAVPLYMAGSWLLIKNPDREIAETSEAIAYYKIGDVEDAPGNIETATIEAGKEISDKIFAYTDPVSRVITGGLLHQFDTDTAYPVNKLPIDWNTPIGIAKAAYGSAAYTERSYLQSQPDHAGVWNVSEFCTDCHDGNSGLHTVAAPMFSEDRALRNQTTTSNNAGNAVAGDTINWKGSYDIGYSHDQNARHCGRQMQFNPEDANTFGPHCRNCHKGSSGCGRCHSNSSQLASGGSTTAIYTTYVSLAANNNRDRAAGGINGYYNYVYPGIQGQSTYAETQTTTGESNMVIDGNPNTPHAGVGGSSDQSFTLKKSRTIAWYTNWRESTSMASLSYDADGNLTSVGSGSTCGDDGFSWPHRTMGWKMLKDDLFGLDFIGDLVQVGGTRSYDPDGPGGTPAVNYVVHDLDSVCLDCHNPTVWRATSAGDHEDTGTTSADNYDDELLLRGLP